MLDNHARDLLRSGDLGTLFIEELGWDNHRLRLDLDYQGLRFTFRALAHKRGMVAWHYKEQGMPDRSTRIALGAQLRKSSHEYIAIFEDDRGIQTWLWVGRRDGRRVVRQHTLIPGQSGEALLQKLESISFTLEEEVDLTITQVVTRAQNAFDLEAVTSRFYSRFKTERTDFRSFISGIDETADADWYSSLMLNRLMFIYFIQKKGFLDGDSNYLRNRLKAVRSRDDFSFHSFYRYFLIRLFHEGLARRHRNEDLEALLGDVPYLNGGLFDQHALESKYSEIDVPDSAFEKLMSFFEEYEWHLDPESIDSDNEINPDVLGYIFEKHINNQWEMGAYYTREDITEYMTRNSIAASILDSGVLNDIPWQLSASEPDAFIRQSLLHQVDAPQPPGMQGRLDDIEFMDTVAPHDFALAEETHREVLERRMTVARVRSVCSSGGIRGSLSALRLNLDVHQLVLASVESIDNYADLAQVFERVAELRVLDPTCGSGAFLFAAMNCLEELYEALLLKAAELSESATGGSIYALTTFRQSVNRSNSRRYQVLKTIMLNNLFGVDIMEEAVEICKLRLFLKLVAQIDKRTDLAPLPDIDFNVKPGNALVGYCTVDAALRDVAARLDFSGDTDSLQSSIEDLHVARREFRVDQAADGISDSTVADVKSSIVAASASLAEELDRTLARSHSVISPSKLETWRREAMPFHWATEFHEVISAGGFDVIVGNPPYVRLPQVTNYVPHGFATLPAGDLYPLVMERGFDLVKRGGRISWIVPVSSLAGEKFASVQEILLQHETLSSSYDDRPSKLFADLEHIRLAIHLIRAFPSGKSMHTSRYHRWRSSERRYLFDRIQYVESGQSIVPASIAKFGSDTDLAILSKLRSHRSRLSEAVATTSPYRIYYTRKLGSFVQILDFVPAIFDASGARRNPSELKVLHFRSEREAYVALGALNSNLFYWFVRSFSDCRNLNLREIRNFPVDIGSLAKASLGKELEESTRALMTDIDTCSEVRRLGQLRIQNTFPARSRRYIDKLDALLGEFLKFTPGELNWILGYDSKYRGGRS